MYQLIREKFSFAFRRYIASMLFLHLVTFVLHLVELLVNLVDGKNTFNPLVLLQLFINDSQFIVTYSTYLFVFYLLIYFMSDFAARMLLAFVLILTLSIQIGLMQYFLISNMLLGADLWNYTWHDIRMTVSASTSISWWQLIVFPLVIGLAMRLHYAFQQNTFSLLISAIIAVVYVGLSIVNGSQGIIALHQMSDKNLALNKSHYFITKTAEFVAGNQANSPYMQLELQASLGAYPFEKPADQTDKLGPYLNRLSATPPNLVFIVVEGLGKTFVGDGAAYKGCMPFLDSLSTKSLFWTNFLSTSGRTFGVLPSLLASLPYGKSGFMEEANIPNHTSLPQLLKQNGYRTAFYYGGDVTFDGQKRFLTGEGVDAIIDQTNYGPEYQKLPENDGGFTWGYGDDALFKNSLSYISKTKQPYFNTYLTVTTHEPFVINNPERYEGQFAQYAKSTQHTKEVNANKAAFITLMYTDDAIRKFIQAYQKRPEYKNTIFVITGDHRMIPVNHKNAIDRYHVPLIIYSPLLKTSRVFKSMCSHTDIPATFMAYLSKQYKVQMPDKVHWMGQGLTFGTTFSSDLHLPIMRNKGQISDYVYGNYFISDGDLSIINDNLELTPKRDDEVAKKGLEYIQKFKQLNEYVCTQDKLYSIKFKATTPTYTANQDEDVIDTTPFEEEEAKSPPPSVAAPVKAEAKTPASGKQVVEKTKPNRTTTLPPISSSDALKQAQAFVLNNPSNAMGYYQLGLEHKRLKNYSWAKANFEKALALNYKLKEAYVALIELELDLNDNETARWYYYKAIGVFDREEFEPQLEQIKSK